MDIIRIDRKVMEEELYRVLVSRSFLSEKARRCAAIFTDNSLDGVYSHGINRFSRFVEYVDKGFIKSDMEAVCVHGKGGMEVWDGQSGPGPINAMQCTRRATELAKENGIGCVALARTNHWMRGGAYGWHAARAGFGFIGWTNTVANTPAWGAQDNKLGNNPLVLAVPFGEDAIVLDMAMSQFSYGALEQYKLKGEKLPVAGGYDRDGNLTDDPSKILSSKRVLPIGYWKGAGLSLLLDVLATALSGGLSTSRISQKPSEIEVSQVFIAIDLGSLPHGDSIEQLLAGIIDDYHASDPIDKSRPVRYPGERVLQTRKRNLMEGIPVHRSVWDNITKL